MWYPCLSNNSLDSCLIVCRKVGKEVVSLPVDHMGPYFGKKNLVVNRERKRFLNWAMNYTSDICQFKR